MAQIAIMGHGVVGSGVAEIVLKSSQSLAKKAGTPIEIKYILDLRDFPDLSYSEKFIKDFNIILEDPEVSVVVEVMGGLHPAYDFVKASLQAGKSVVTSNKELVAAKGAELLAIAAEKHVNFLFEASVGGGIPIIRPLHQCLGANEITEIAGILNGTTNFILTKMIREGSTFDDALAEAQRLGYAERNPAADVEGMDACRKICILASLAFGSHIYPDRVPTQGITKITPEDVQYAADWNGVIKLLGRAKLGEDEKVQIAVSPCFISHESQLASVDDVFNGILVRGDATGDVVFYGKGAGKLPTASAVVADIIDVLKAKDTIATLHWKDGDGSNLADPAEEELACYLRVSGEKAAELVEAAFGEVAVLHRSGASADEFACILPAMAAAQRAAKLEELSAKGIEVLGSIVVAEV
ncbi:MAG: homoserine dehydrogenase [Oscillospiraceae bacterium]|nr:homoserine dehydrogenase [Oscillospiraceae bacterium]